MNSHPKFSSSHFPNPFDSRTFNLNSISLIFHIPLLTWMFPFWPIPNFHRLALLPYLSNKITLLLPIYQPFILKTNPFSFRVQESRVYTNLQFIFIFYVCDLRGWGGTWTEVAWHGKNKQKKKNSELR